MKIQVKTLILSLFLIASSAASFAQNSSESRTKYFSPKFSDNIYISIGAGAELYLNSYNKNFNKKSITPAFNVSVGKNFTPIWGLRAQASGYNAKVYAWGDAKDPMEHNYIGLGLDFMLNVTNVFRQYEENRWFDVMAFAGPGLYVGRFKSNNDDITALTNVSAGLGLKFHVSNSLAIDIEGRARNAASMFPATGNAQDQILTATAGLTYTFGGRKFVSAQQSGVAQSKYDALAAEAAALKNENANLKNRKPEVIEKVVTKEVSYIGEIPSAVITFPFNVSRIPQNQAVTVYNWAEFLKNNPNVKISLKGYADKVGSKAANDKISSQRAQAVKNLLVKNYGIAEDRISADGKGYVDIYNQNSWNRSVLINIVK